jgi:hypothetical protein
MNKTIKCIYEYAKTDVNSEEELIQKFAEGMLMQIDAAFRTQCYNIDDYMKLSDNEQFYLVGAGLLHTKIKRQFSED